MSWNRVYLLVKRIPRGRVTTYGEVAKALRLRGGARAVGYVMAKAGITLHDVAYTRPRQSLCVFYPTTNPLPVNCPTS